jgi:predicted MFS family arabinose efflux permease
MKLLKLLGSMFMGSVAAVILVYLYAFLPDHETGYAITVTCVALPGAIVVGAMVGGLLGALKLFWLRER